MTQAPTGRAVPLTPLANFFGSYLHEDFPLIHHTAWEAIQAFVRLEPLSWRVDARNELGELLRSSSTEEALRDAAGRRLLAYHPPADNMTYREWLEKVERYLRDHES